MMGSIGSVTKIDTPCTFFSDPIVGQLEELEGRICNIMGPETVAQVKANISAVCETCGKGVNKNQLKIYGLYMKNSRLKPLIIIHNCVSIIMTTSYINNSPLTL